MLQADDLAQSEEESRMKMIIKAQHFLFESIEDGNPFSASRFGRVEGSIHEVVSDVR